MMNKKILLYIVFPAVAFFIACNLTTPISPGPLSSGHADLEGSSNCTQCHVLGKWVSDSKCMDCHTEIKERVDGEKGYHSSEEVTSKKCSECHSDHHGKDFEIIHFDTLKFEHKLTGYKLEGAHAEANCLDCHRTSHIQNEEFAEKDFTYLGLSSSCLNCHEDYHQETLSDKCSDCHGFDNFDNPTYFNHDDTKYPLVGEHINVECEECHQKGLRNDMEFQQFADIEHSSCLSCHEDVHNGKLGQNCSDCHTEKSFKEIKNLHNFNHDLTAYPLVGMHVNVDCYDCHKSSCTSPLAHSSCTDCHDDYHKGTFVKNGKTKDCKECHSIQGFKVPQYTIAQHQTSKFPLDGAHVAVACTECHRKGSEWAFRKIGKKCVDCHTDVHKSYIGEKYYPNKSCKSCHTNDTWHKISFNHSKTNFDLKGAHKSQSCRDCHYKTTNGQTKQVFAGLNKNCASCHQEVHNKQFEIQGVTDCAKCHGNTDWTASKFNHDNARFKLDGEHINLACNKCHNTVVINRKPIVQYKINKTECKDCH